MNVRNEKQIQSSAADRRAASPTDWLLRYVRLMWGCKIPTVIKLEYLDSQVDPLERYHISNVGHSEKGQETELTISPIQLRSCGVRERRMPLKSKEDSANVVGIAPLALPLDLAMEVWDPWPKAVGLTGLFLALPCQSSILQHRTRRPVLSLFGLSGSPANKPALIK